MMVIVDYGMGNLRSVSKALESLGAALRVSGDPGDVAKAEKLILPGVGAFPAAMRELGSRKLVEPIKAAIASGKPYLGICLGLQLLFDRSEEGEGGPGLAVLPGTVRRFTYHSSLVTRHSKLKIPHMGWNQVTRSQKSEVRSQAEHGVQIVSEAQRENGCPLLAGIPDGSFVYFVHSYYADPADRAMIALESDYGVRFAAMVWRGNLFAT